MREWWISLLEPDGLLLRDKALTAVDPDDVLTALRSGRLRRIQRGIYLPRRIETTPLVLARAALISSGVVGAVPSHQTAARVHQLEVPDDHRVQHVTVTREQRRRNRPDLRFYSRSIGCGEVEKRDVVPITTVARTLADLATSLERTHAVWALDNALRRRLCAKADVCAVVELPLTARAGVTDPLAVTVTFAAGQFVGSDDVTAPDVKFVRLTP